ncbi:flagellar biosynthetic protein FliO [Cryptosporangium phraense]|uniref:Flagellar protein n=1 Tax=Cryptosporangium phraense TaxID=2593070 RepID=A0A545AE12_9ACTN|nr:flagellar biosynthetic protein FliO [Cryptosporangium phraense]TQS39562.1 flagellar biosynthetic protein FliO [Cryptosporangium phraense]
MIEVTLRAIFSLLVVLFLMWGLARLVRRPLGGRAAGALTVLARQQLGRTSSVAVVKVDDRALVLGVTDGQITYLTEARLAAFERTSFDDVLAETMDDDVLASPPRSRAAARHAAHAPAGGSVLSPATWQATIGFFRDRASRPR